MESNLKPCPFCGGEAEVKPFRLYSVYFVACGRCCASTQTYSKEKSAIEAWNRRTSEIVKVETNFYDKEETFENCTVQVLTNTATGDVIVGWWKNDA